MDRKIFKALAMERKTFDIILGPAVFILFSWLLNGIFTFKAAVAISLTVWMGLWWILRPVDIAVTSFLPIAINALFDLVPPGHIISQYFSEIVILLVGSDLISLTWTNSGLDRRLAVNALCFIGTSVRQQITIWLVASAVLSSILPNVVVVMIFVPIAVSMLKFLGEESVGSSKLAIPILLAIAWGAGIGGFGSPLGGAANLTAIAYLEKLIGHEFMYVDWIIRFIPFLAFVILLNLVILLAIPVPVKRLADTSEYFSEIRHSLGKINRGELLGLVLFALATVLAFLRPAFADIFPSLRPAYIFFILGLLTFILKDENHAVMLTWKQAEKELMWGMFFLFAGGLALGRIVTETGACHRLAALIAELPLSGGIETMGVFTIFSTFLSEISSNTAAASIAIPVIQSIAEELGLNPIPYILVTIVAVNCAYILPVSTRAVPVSCGLNPAELFRSGLKLSILNIIMTTVLGYLAMLFWPLFNEL